MRKNSLSEESFEKLLVDGTCSKSPVAASNRTGDPGRGGAMRTEGVPGGGRGLGCEEGLSGREIAEDQTRRPWEAREGRGACAIAIFFHHLQYMDQLQEQRPLTDAEIQESKQAKGKILGLAAVQKTRLRRRSWLT
jgi:hypothetical protein